MKDIKIRLDGRHWAFLHTRDLGATSSLRLRGYRGPEGRWDTTGNAPPSASQGLMPVDGHRLDLTAEPNTLATPPAVPEDVLGYALERAGEGTAYRGQCS